MKGALGASRVNLRKRIIWRRQNRAHRCTTKSVESTPRDEITGGEETQTGSSPGNEVALRTPMRILTVASVNQGRWNIRKDSSHKPIVSFKSGKLGGRTFPTHSASRLQRNPLSVIHPSSSRLTIMTQYSKGPVLFRLARPEPRDCFVLETFRLGVHAPLQQKHAG